jgi:hypothetical protein
LHGAVFDQLGEPGHSAGLGPLAGREHVGQPVGRFRDLGRVTGKPGDPVRDGRSREALAAQRGGRFQR